MSGAGRRSAGRRVGIDVGGTKAQGVALAPDGTVLAQVRRDTPRGEQSLEPLVDRLVEMATELGAEEAIGIGVPGLVDRSGVLHAAPNLDGVADFDIRSRLRDRLDLEVHVDNDGTNTALAEWQLGAGRGATDMLVATLGTGIGGGIVADGRLHRGRNGFAGEFGHMVVHPDGPECPCGRRGCWETFASGTGLARLARDAASDHRLGSVLDRVGGDPAAVRGEHLLAAARDGDPQAVAVIDHFSWWVALGLSNLTNAFDPQLFVLGGGVAEGADLYLEPIERHFRDRLYQSHLRPLPDIRFAEWGPLAGAVGAALLPRFSGADD